jgi:hypothetical protein
MQSYTKDPSTPGSLPTWDRIYQAGDWRREKGGMYAGERRCQNDDMWQTIHKGYERIATGEAASWVYLVRLIFSRLAVKKNVFLGHLLI